MTSDFCVWHGAVNILLILIFSFVLWHEFITSVGQIDQVKSYISSLPWFKKIWYVNKSNFDIHHAFQNIFFKLQFQKLQPLLHKFLKHWINYVNQMQINIIIKVQYSSHELFLSLKVSRISEKRLYFLMASIQNVWFTVRGKLCFQMYAAATCVNFLKGMRWYNFMYKIYQLCRTRGQQMRPFEPTILYI